MLKYPKNQGGILLEDTKKEKLKTWLLMVMILSLVSSFVLFFIGHYMLGFAIGGVFMMMAIVLGQWSYNKNADYVHRNIHSSHKKW